MYLSKRLKNEKHPNLKERARTHTHFQIAGASRRIPMNYGIAPYNPQTINTLHTTGGRCSPSTVQYGVAEPTCNTSSVAGVAPFRINYNAIPRIDLVPAVVNAPSIRCMDAASA